MDFNNLQTQEVQVPERKKKINFSEVLDLPNEDISLGKPNHDKEPGIKIGTGSFLSVAQYCETCERITPHAHKSKERKMRCLICKEDYRY